MMAVDVTKAKRQLRMLREVLARPYAWPGGYEKLLYMEDGGLLCSKCVKECCADIMGDIEGGYSSGWSPAAVTYEAVGAEDSREVNYCSHCNREFGEFGR